LTSLLKILKKAGINWYFLSFNIFLQ